jgi:hypothetical protein
MAPWQGAEILACDKLIVLNVVMVCQVSKMEGSGTSPSAGLQHFPLMKERTAWKPFAPFLFVQQPGNSLKIAETGSRDDSGLPRIHIWKSFTCGNEL